MGHQQASAALFNMLEQGGQRRPMQARAQPGPPMRVQPTNPMGGPPVGPGFGAGPGPAPGPGFGAGPGPAPGPGFGPGPAPGPSANPFNNILGGALAPQQGRPY